MIRLRRRTIRMMGAAVAAGWLVGMAGVGVAITGAHADPGFETAGAAGPKVGVGSDTIQNVMEAYTNSFEQGVTYPQFRSSSATGYDTVASFLALAPGATAAAPGCITTKLNGPSFDRPNGSSNGVAALLDSFQNTNWWLGQSANGAGNTPLASCTGATATTNGVPVNNQIDFARSSRDIKSAGNTLTFIPFARDALGYAFWDHNTGNAASLTTPQLISLYNDSGATPGEIKVGSDTVVACIVQAGSGTISFWATALGVTGTNLANVGTATQCGDKVSGEIEEHSGDAFLSRATVINNALSTTPIDTLLPGTTQMDFVVPMSSAVWASMADGVAPDLASTLRAAEAGQTFLGAGTIDGVAPLTGSAPSFLPNTPFYQCTGTVNCYGRNVFVVVPTTKLGTGVTTRDLVLQSLFDGPSSTICSASAQATAHSFGLDSLTASEGTCGATTDTGAF